MSYLDSLIWDMNNFGTGTESWFNYIPKIEDVFVNGSLFDENATWILSQMPVHEREIQDTGRDKIAINASVITKVKKTKKRKGKKIKRTHKGKGKIKKCFLKLLKKKGKQGKKMHKYMLPLILGLVLAKSLLIPIVLKALTVISAKGLMMGFFSTILASILSFKNMFGSHRYQSRIDDADTRVEIIRLPQDGHYYKDLHNREFYTDL